jgi:hypothetical protein
MKSLNMNQDQPQTPRAQNGTYKHADGICVCGHGLGDHDAERVKINTGTYLQECQEVDCDCQTFAKPRKAKK